MSDFWNDPTPQRDGDAPATSAPATPAPAPQVVPPVASMYGTGIPPGLATWEC